MPIRRLKLWRGGMRAGVLLATLSIAQAFAADAPVLGPRLAPRPVISAEAGATCVADTEFMRKNHMDLLKHQRSETVHQGIRTPRFSLKGCINCHASKQTQSVAAEAGDFCRGCHEYAGVTLDCFECHNPKAQAKPVKAALAPPPATMRTPAAHATTGKKP